jgi:hypothetical protein
MSKMFCGLCEKEVHPLDAHMGRIRVLLEVFHIDCWNEFHKEEIKEEKLRKKQEEDDIFNLLQGMNELMR